MKAPKKRDSGTQPVAAVPPAAAERKTDPEYMRVVAMAALGGSEVLGCDNPVLSHLDAITVDLELLQAACEGDDDRCSVSRLANFLTRLVERIAIVRAMHADMHLEKVSYARTATQGGA